MRSRNRLAVAACLLGIAVLAPSSAHAGRPRRGDAAARTPTLKLDPSDQVIEFQQVCWDLEMVQLRESNWGQVAIDPDALRRKMKEGRGYINVFLFTPGSNSPTWVVENLSVAPVPCSADAGETPARPDPRSAHFRQPPICRYLDLTPGVDAHRGRIPTVEATVLATAQPLPVADEILRLVEKFPPVRFHVGVVKENAEGFLPDALVGTFPPREVHPTLPLGAPPPALSPEPGPSLDLAYPICVFQTAGPNIECAKNQCVPMAQANTIQYLEDRYNGIPLVWSMPEVPIPGIGWQGWSGDILIWEPIPPQSLIANVDFFTRRLGVFDNESGNGSTICQLFQGLMGYLTAAGPYTKAEFWHQGTNSPTIGEGTTCDYNAVDLGGNVSNRQGENPTWQWIFDQLSLGRGVAICFGRYDVDGNRTSGHCVRVWGACRIGTTKYLYTLDDGHQGDNEDGTRTQVWNVADTGSPGMPGVPDGRLNMDGMSWEIEFANSIRAKPTLVIP